MKAVLRPGERAREAADGAPVDLTRTEFDIITRPIKRLTAAAGGMARLEVRDNGGAVVRFEVPLRP